MIKERATVVSLSGNRAEVQMQRQSACSHCEMSHGCGTGAIGRLLGKRSKPVNIEVDQDMKAGDSVELGLPDKAFLKASLLIYGLPILGLFIGAMVAEAVFTDAEFMVFVFAMAGLISGLAISARIAKIKFAAQFNPKILSVISEPPQNL